ncbi:hypothetical protein GGR56DRAFT_507921 [Xylariaceae sp. FL0804]|nr:hypothetical protein GGR56DRAFT_507921 [Xylariaceae sp. FL0804]
MSGNHRHQHDQHQTPRTAHSFTYKQPPTSSCPNSIFLDEKEISTHAVTTGLINKQSAAHPRSRYVHRLPHLVLVNSIPPPHPTTHLPRRRQPSSPTTKMEDMRHAQATVAMLAQLIERLRPDPAAPPSPSPALLPSRQPSQSSSNAADDSGGSNSNSSSPVTATTARRTTGSHHHRSTRSLGLLQRTLSTSSSPGVLGGATRWGAMPGSAASGAGSSGDRGGGGLRSSSSTRSARSGRSARSARSARRQEWDESVEGVLWNELERPLREVADEFEVDQTALKEFISSPEMMELGAEFARHYYDEHLYDDAIASPTLPSAALTTTSPTIATAALAAAAAESDPAASRRRHNAYWAAEALFFDLQTLKHDDVEDRWTDNPPFPIPTSSSSSSNLLTKSNSASSSSSLASDATTIIVTPTTPTPKPKPKPCLPSRRGGGGFSTSSSSSSQQRSSTPTKTTTTTRRRIDNWDLADHLARFVLLAEQRRVDAGVSAWLAWEWGDGGGGGGKGALAASVAFYLGVLRCYTMRAARQRQMMMMTTMMNSTTTMTPRITGGGGGLVLLARGGSVRSTASSASASTTTTTTSTSTSTAVGQGEYDASRAARPLSFV